MGDGSSPQSGKAPPRMYNIGPGRLSQGRNSRSSKPDPMTTGSCVEDERHTSFDADEYLRRQWHGVERADPAVLTQCRKTSIDMEGCRPRRISLDRQFFQRSSVGESDVSSRPDSPATPKGRGPKIPAKDKRASGVTLSEGVKFHLASTRSRKTSGNSTPACPPVNLSVRSRKTSDDSSPYCTAKPMSVRSRKTSDDSPYCTAKPMSVRSRKTSDDSLRAANPSGVDPSLLTGSSGLLSSRI